MSHDQVVQSAAYAPDRHHSQIINISEHGRMHLGDNYTYNVRNAPEPNKREEILRHLSFPEMFSRCHDIQQEHEGTCTWILAEKSENKGWSAYSDWLASEQSMFWVSGKPGSGKSVLMKYLYETALDQAAEDASLVLSFWLWEAGTKLQHSYQGCLRGLLCQCLTSSFVPKLTTVQESLLLRSQALPPRTLRKILIELLLATRKDVTGVIIFIDGIDESGSDSKDILSLVDEVACQVDGIKICVSSRPEPLLKARLKCHPTLDLHEFNRQDIDRVIEDELFGDPVVSVQINKNRELEKVLRHSLQAKADGVFLWVILAIQSLILGLGNNDSIKMLEERLDTLPSDLNELYDVMLSRNGDDMGRYRQIAGLYFQLVFHLDRPTLLEFCLWTDDGLRAKLLDPDRWSDIASVTASLPTVQDARIWINARSGGLLQLGSCLSGSECTCHMSRVEEYQHLRIDMIHRTALTYLQTTLQGQEILDACSISESGRADICFEIYLITAFILLGLDSTDGGRVGIILRRYCTCRDPTENNLHLASKIWVSLLQSNHLLIYHGWLGPYLSSRSHANFSTHSFQVPFPCLTNGGLDYARIYAMLGWCNPLDKILQSHQKNLCSVDATIWLFEVLYLCSHAHEIPEDAAKLQASLYKEVANFSTTFETIHGKQAVFASYYLPELLYLAQNPFTTLGDVTGKLMDSGVILTNFSIDSVMHTFHEGEICLWGNITLSDIIELSAQLPSPTPVESSRIFVLAVLSSKLGGRAALGYSSTKLRLVPWLYYPITEAQSDIMLSDLKGAMPPKGYPKPFSCYGSGALRLQQRLPNVLAILERHCSGNTPFRYLPEALKFMGMTQQDIDTFCEQREQFLRQLNPYENGIPHLRARFMIEPEENIGLLNDEYEQEWGRHEISRSTTPDGEPPERKRRNEQSLG